MAAGPPSAVASPPPPPSARQPPSEDAPPRWPLWLPLAAVAIGFVVLTVLATITQLVGVDTSSPGFNAGATAMLDLVVVASSILLAGATMRPRAWHFGLRSAPLRRTAAIAAIGAGVYFIFSLVYSAIVQPKSPQKVVETLGADTNTALLVSGAVVVILVAPVCEELFFRGFLYRVLRLRTGAWVSALIGGVLFGIVHGSSTAISVLPILAVLGIVFCWVYERTGTLFATIALHALNNTISYGASTDNGWAAALVVGGVVIAGCVVGLKRAPRPVPRTASP